MSNDFVEYAINWDICFYSITKYIIKYLHMEYPSEDNTAQKYFNYYLGSNQVKSARNV